MLGPVSGSTLYRGLSALVLFLEHPRRAPGDGARAVLAERQALALGAASAENEQHAPAGGLAVQGAVTGMAARLHAGVCAHDQRADRVSVTRPSSPGSCASITIT